VLLDEAAADPRFNADPYVRCRMPRSVLCVPITRGQREAGLLYLENDLVARAFTPERLALVEHLAAQAAIALDNARLFAEVRRGEAESAGLAADLRRLASEIVAAEDSERRQLARDLHDSIGQSLPAIKLELETLAARRGEPLLGDIAGRLGAIHQQARTLTFELYPAILDDLGLFATLEHYARKLADEGLCVSVDACGQPRPLSHERAILAFRAARELLRNVVKHAHAREAMVTLAWRDATLRITVSDDGVGFDSLTPWHRGGLGLFDVRERLSHLGGGLRIDSTLGGGTVVMIDIPLEAADGGPP